MTPDRTGAGVAGRLSGRGPISLLIDPVAATLTIERLLNLEADLRRLNLTGRAITAAKN